VFPSLLACRGRCKPHRACGGSISIVVSSFSCSDLVRAPTERAESQRGSALDSLRLFPRRLFCRQLDGCGSLSHLYSALCAWQASASGSLSSHVCTLSLSLRGFPASWRRLSQLRHVALCRASVAWVRGVGLPWESPEGLWYETCRRLWKGPAFDARLRHASRASRLVRLAGLRFHAEGRSCACCSVLGNALSREAGGHHTHGPLRSPVERAGRDQYHREWVTEGKETSDATASNHDP
jgi:hypothetical protein